MSIALKVGAGLVAGAAAGLLGFLFWPRIEPGVVAARPAVEKPEFVVAAAPAKPAAAPAIVVAAAPVVGDKASLEKLAVALKTDVSLAPAPAPPKLSPPSEDAARFCAQGLVALADGDIAGARLFLQRSADAGDARALMALGDTYDSTTLARLGVVGMKGDSERARDYYSRALAAGVGAAKERIAALEAHGN